MIVDGGELAAIEPRHTMLVIQCSAGKEKRGGRPPAPTSVTPWPEALLSARARLRVPAHVDERLVMPAWRRYKGHFYQQAGEALGEAVAAGVPVIILSGGYGLLRPEEPIGYYERELRRRDWPPMLLESLLADEAAKVGADAVVAFTATTPYYAKLVRGAPWRQRGIAPVFHVTVTVDVGNPRVEVPRQLGQAFTALRERDLGGFPAGLSVERLA